MIELHFSQTALLTVNSMGICLVGGIKPFISVMRSFLLPNSSQGNVQVLVIINLFDVFAFVGSP